MVFILRRRGRGRMLVSTFDWVYGAIIRLLEKRRNRGEHISLTTGIYARRTTLQYIRLGTRVFLLPTTTNLLNIYLYTHLSSSDLLPSTKTTDTSIYPPIHLSNIHYHHHHHNSGRNITSHLFHPFYDTPSVLSVCSVRGNMYIAVYT